MLTLRFLGAAQNVTGSRFLLEADGTRILVDCGLYQERPFLHRNWDPFPVPPASIDAVLLTHAHLDHTGYLPRLVRDGFRGPVYCTPATADIASVILEDSAHIQEEDAAFKKRRHAREGRRGPYPEVPLYTSADAEEAIGLFRTVQYDRELELPGGVRAVFRNAGHILGAAVLLLEAGKGSARRRVLFSGDLGRKDAPLVRDPETFSGVDYVVVESTYGDRLHESTQEADDHLARVINSTVEAGGNVIIPSFAVERAQEVLYLVHGLVRERRIPRLMYFLDSPMATDVTRIFERHEDLLDPELGEMLRRGESPFHFPGLHHVRSVEESKAINHIVGSVVIIAGSGMCTGGRIKHHLANNIGDPHSTVLFVGYQAEGTLGRQILDGQNPVRILGQMHQVRARIERIEAFSAHADRDGLLGWLGALDVQPREVFVVHGEQESAMAFAARLKESTGWRVRVPKYGERAVLE